MGVDYDMDTDEAQERVERESFTATCIFCGELVEIAGDNCVAIERAFSMAYKHENCPSASTEEPDHD